MPQPPNFRVVFNIDEDFRPDGSDGKPLPESPAYYATNQHIRDGEPVPYEEYVQYWGNPDRHVGLMVDVQKQCGHCSMWHTAASLCGIDMMDDDKAVNAINHGESLTVAEALALPGYLRDVSIETLIEAGWEPPADVLCTSPGCKFVRYVGDDVKDLRRCWQHQPTEPIPRAPYRALSTEETMAVRLFADAHGGRWKQALRDKWTRAGEPGILQRLRNELGPTWLDGFRFDKTK